MVILLPTITNKVSIYVLLPTKLTMKEEFITIVVGSEGREHVGMVIERVGESLEVRYRRTLCYYINNNHIRFDTIHYIWRISNHE